MSKYEKLLERIRALDRGLRFEELEKVLLRNGYVGRNPGSSHTTFRKPGRLLAITIPKHKPIDVVYIELVKKALEEEGVL